MDLKDLFNLKRILENKYGLDEINKRIILNNMDACDYDPQRFSQWLEDEANTIKNKL